jgi:hypothetical protein
MNWPRGLSDGDAICRPEQHLSGNATTRALDYPRGNLVR